MAEPLAYLNGQFIPAGALSVPVYDAGFVLGATVTEQLRTFGGRLFHVEDHFARLRRSLEIVGLQLPQSGNEFQQAAKQLASANHRWLDPADDLGLSIFVTPGDYPSFTEGRTSGPVVAMHTFRLPFDRWAAVYESGCALATTPVQQVPGDCWPPELKCRSRMHYYLADREAQRKDTHARALLLDREGRVTETATANVLAYRSAEGLFTPRQENVLHGISLAFARELAGRLGLAFVERDIGLDDLVMADEVMLTSTPNCLLPVTRLNGRAIGDGRPGNVHRQLLSIWSEAVGLDIAGQAVQFSSR
jgi:branched-subunit amino acid aminotransferase/4-amino-4-deoxychorismate lyase